MTRPIRWLHLSDLHLGCRGETLWWQTQEEFERHVKAMTARLGMPDLVLLTGDLTNRGVRGQFDLVDRFLDALLGWLREEGGGPDPLVVPVPGNHDLKRPGDSAAARYLALRQMPEADADPDVKAVRDRLFHGRKPSAAFISPLFKEYVAWFDRRVAPELAKRATVHRSYFPGELSVEVHPDGAFTLGIVGLNSTWVQYRDLKAGELWMAPEQLQHALPPGASGSALDSLKRWDRTLLLTHHPPEWLHPRARDRFDELVDPTGRFAAHLYGHMHEGRSEFVAVCCGEPRYRFQSPSLFGVERYGTSREERRIGYAWGEIHSSGEVRLWPFVRTARGFLHDQHFGEQQDDGVVLRPADGERTSHKTAPGRPDLTGHLESLVARTSHVDIVGIGTAAGSQKGAVRYPIEQLYTPLWTRGRAGEEDPGALLAAERVPLSQLLSSGRHLLVVGEPGAGKSTFVNLVACLFARDLLGQRPPGGGTWRERYLGLPEGGTAPVPVLIRLSELAGCMVDRDLRRHRDDDRHWLTTMLGLRCGHGGHRVPAEQWEELLDRGQAALLLDGLDEVADERLRRRLFAVFSDAARAWERNLVVVTTRPLSVEAVQQMGFETATIERFADEDIRAFVDRWVPGLYGEVGAAALSEVAEGYRNALLAEITARPEVRRLAANPVMLTCLCVVHFNEGKRLPEGRCNVYKAVVKWLLGARRNLREEAGFNDDFALRCLARLALAMMGHPGGSKTVRCDLQDAMRVVLPEVERDFGDRDATPEARRDRARRWLDFECLWSGIVEQRRPGEVGFRHLTFLEFLAARRLSWLGDDDDGEDAWWPVIRAHLHDGQWHETLELLPGCLLEGGQGRADRLLGRILAEGEGSEPDLLRAARVVGAIGRLLPPLEVESYRPRPDVPAAYETARQRVMPIFELDGAARVPWQERVAAAEALGRAGDPRLEPGAADLLLPVPETEVLLGRFPVTVQEYRRFVEDRGYEAERWWTSEGWSFRQRDGWTAPERWQEQLEHPNRPVTGVSWYEADAYCRWLGQVRDDEVRLPTGAEWEAAASPAEGEYPWGSDEPTPEHASFGWSVDAATPVGVYPLGAGPHGHLDLAGNVWEWSADESGASHEERESLRDIVGDKVDARWSYLRGGCWFYPARNLRAASRVRSPAGRRINGAGFRVAVSGASP